MVNYRHRPIEVEAYRWFQNGDHPNDGPADREGQVVRYFRSPDPDYAGHMIHDRCGKTWHEHGWIDAGFDESYDVCPGNWIVTDDDGSYYVVDHEDFVKCFDPI